MKSHRDQKYRREAPTPGHGRPGKVSQGLEQPTLLTRLKRTRLGDSQLVLPVAMLTGFSLGTRLWFQLLHGAIWLTKTPIGPRGAKRASRRLSRGPMARVVKCCRNKGRCQLRVKPLGVHQEKRGAP